MNESLSSKGYVGYEQPGKLHFCIFSKKHCQCLAISDKPLNTPSDAQHALIKNLAIYERFFQTTKRLKGGITPDVWRCLYYYFATTRAAPQLK
jgi:hypothetical protein